MHTMEYYSAITKNETMSFAASWMDLEIITLSEVSQKDKYHMIITYMWNLKCDTIGHLWNRNTLIDMENRLVVAKGKAAGGRVDWEFGISRYKLLYIKWINNTVLLYSTGNFIQYSLMNHDGKEYLKRMYVYTCITDSLYCTAEVNKTL